MTPSRLTTAAAAVVFAAGVAGCGSVSSAGAGQPAPPKLRLATSAAPSPGPSGNATGPPGMALPVTPGVPGWAQVELTGALPTTGPGKGAVRSLSGGQAPAATVRALAAALHLSGSPRRVTGGWRSTGPGALQVFDGPGLRWTYLGGPIVHWCYYGPPIRISGVNPPGGMGAMGGGAARQTHRGVPNEAGPAGARRAGSCAVGLANAANQDERAVRDGRRVGRQGRVARGRSRGRAAADHDDRLI